MGWGAWVPWRFIVRRAFAAHGFLDPFALLARLRALAQPSEVGEPLELVRAGMVFHARGLINSRVIQHNLDWVWPYWAERQFDPRDDAFIPRAFSITHVNLTHRNWTALGLPDEPELPIVDPRGLLTPFLDGWSLDAWVVWEGGALLPSRCEAAEQRLELDGGLAVRTVLAEGGAALVSRSRVLAGLDGPVCRLELSARGPAGACLAVALRPCNPEGVSFVERVEALEDGTGWSVDRRRTVRFLERPERCVYSSYAHGDVLPLARARSQDGAGVQDKVGLATAAAVFPLADGARSVTVEVPLAPRPRAPRPPWDEALRGACRLEVPDARAVFLHEAALRTLVLLSPDDVYPGPYTYKRFWFRDAAFIIHALLSAGLTSRAERALARFAPRQTAQGYFLSQEGEWDSNGEALWILARRTALTGGPPRPEWRAMILSGARWIARKRLPPGTGPHAGLLPAGFSAEHLGPNDYYYWDDFWGAAGLRAAGDLAQAYGERAAAAEFRREGADLLAAVERSLAAAAARLRTAAMPASPYRRLDAGAVGSLAAGYPLELWEPRDPRLLATVEHLMARCFHEGLFFQDMIHSGGNPYLTLHAAQVLLRAGDPRAFALMRRVAEAASPTGQWPEAIHPRTGGGCMGDGQHAWAAAEWLLMLRNCFLREEQGRLVLGAGLPPEWQGARLSYGPAPTEFGTVSVRLAPAAGGVEVSWEGAWRGAPPAVEARLPGRAPRAAEPGARRLLA